jgi:hypothetical protein
VVTGGWLLILTFDLRLSTFDRYRRYKNEKSAAAHPALSCIRRSLREELKRKFRRIISSPLEVIGL